jgi:hypothetical protein
VLGRVQIASLGRALAVLETPFQWLFDIVMPERGEVFFDFGGEAAGLRDASQCGQDRDFARRHAQQLAALELTAAAGAFRVDCAGAITRRERRARLGNPHTAGKERRVVAGLGAHIREENAVAAQAALET